MSNQPQNPSMTIEKATGMITRMQNQITTIVIQLEDNINQRDTRIAELTAENEGLKKALAEISDTKAAEVPRSKE